MAQKSLFKTSTVAVVVKTGRAVFTGILISPTTESVNVSLHNSTDTTGRKIVPTGTFIGSSVAPGTGYGGAQNGFEVKAENGIYLSMSTATGAEVTVYYRNG